MGQHLATMRRSRRGLFFSLFGILGTALLVGSQVALAHCDTMSGPVVAAARAAIVKGDVSEALWWVRHEDEPEIRAAFTKTMSARKASAAARELSDRYFYETLVRVHRSGEGEAYTGLKPASAPVEQSILLAEAALKERNVDRLADQIAAKIKSGIKKRFAETLGKKDRAGRSVEDGRAYVESYVEYMHYVESAEATATSASEHGMHGDGG